MKKENGITLIALIITIILMLILVAVSVTVALNGGLFSTAKRAVSETDIEAEKERMISISMEAIGQDGQVDFAKLEENLPEEFEKISEGKYKSTKTGQLYIVGPYGTLAYEETFDKKEWDKNASDEDCFVWASDTPGTEGYGTVIGYTEKAQGNTKLVFPSRCTKIEYPSGFISGDEYADARAYVQGIEKVEIPGTVTSIPHGAFYGVFLFQNVKEVNIEYGATSIGNSAFEGCRNLTKVTIPDSVTSIGYYAFSKCESLTNIEIPDTVTYIDGGAFSDCTSLTNITIPDGVPSLGTYAFIGCESLTDITIPNSVTSIGFEAFRNCTALTNITIPNSVTEIGKNAFQNTAWYNNKEDGVVYIGEIVYGYKGEMPSDASISIEIKEGTTVIPDSAFADNINLTSVTIPDSVTSIGSSAFNGCTNLTSVRLPNGLASIGYRAFFDCTSLKNITIPDSITRIESDAFYNCASLESITIPKNVKYMGDAVFGHCTSLSNIIIWQNVDELGYRTFDGWGSNQTVNIEAGSTPSGWHTDWNYGCNAKIEYGYTGQ